MHPNFIEFFTPPNTVTIKANFKNGEHYSEELSLNNLETFFTDLVFYNSSNQKVAPTAGEIEFLVASQGNGLRLATHGKVKASEIYNEDLKMPHAYGPTLKVLVRFKNLTGDLTRFELLVRRK